MGNKQTKEEEIISFIKDNPHCTKDMIVEKFDVTLDYAKVILKITKGTLNKDIFDRQ